MKKILLSLSAIVWCANIFAQNLTMELKDSADLKKNKFDQQYDYENFLSPYAPKKKNNWAIGLGIGTPFILGDVKPYMLGSYAADLKIRKAITHVFSLRYQSIFAEIVGINYADGNSAPKNYKARMTDNTLQMVFTLNNMNFNKKKSRVGFNLFAGGGFASNFTQLNLRDENGSLYDYSTLSNIETFGDRRFSVNEIKNILDKEFETAVLPEASDARINDTRILPSMVLGAGMDVYLSKRIDLAFETRISRHFTDYLDGHKEGTGGDWLMYSSVGLNVKIGKNTEPLYWKNPTNQIYSDVMALKQGADPATSFQDLDQDGVVDILDKDLNTPIGVEVDPSGVALDSDRDGVPNYRDNELATIDGAMVDNNGVAIDSDNDGVPDIKDKDNNTPANAQVDVKGREVKGGGKAAVNNILYMRGVDVWSIFFDTDDYTVKTEYHAIILNLASFMIEDPSAKIIITGYTDSRSSAEYNLALSKKRANSVLAYFSKLGIGADRFEIQYKGEQDLLIEDSNSLGQQLNRRVTLKVK